MSLASDSANPVQGTQDDWNIVTKIQPGTALVVDLIGTANPVRGELVSVSGNILSVQAGTRTRPLPRGRIRGIKVARGSKRNVLVATAIGASIGAVLGRPREDWDASGTLLFTLIGAGAGAALGALLGPAWETVYQAP